MSGNSDATLVLEHIARSQDRSPLFWWMLDHHDEIVKAAQGRRIRWRQFCADVTALGLTDTRGGPVTERNARETWRQVRRETARTEKLRVEREAAKAAAAEARRHYPSRQPIGWRPEVVASAGSQIRAGVPVKREPTQVFAMPEVGADAGLSSEEYRRLRDERGPDGLLTDRALEIRDREVRERQRNMDRWLGLRHRDEEE